MSDAEPPDVFSKEWLISRIHELIDDGWHLDPRPTNQGGAGNLLEDLLGIAENNLPIPNAAEWELKTRESSQNSLITLKHCEPSPTALRFVPQILLPNYGWPHQGAGIAYAATELSFRQTIDNHC